MELINMTISKCFKERVKKTPNKIFLNKGKKSFTWSCVDKLTDRAAEVFLRQGIRSGERVGIFGANSESWIISFLSLQKIGAVTVLINPCFKEKELINCIKIADIKHIFYTNLCDDRSADEIMQRVKNNHELSNLKVYNIEKTYEEWMKLANKKLTSSKLIQEREDANELACILFTSGTTNNCKGVMLSHYSIVNNAREVVRQMRWTQEDSMCLAVPLFHCFGVTVSLLTTIIAGMSISLINKYKTTQVCQAIEENKCTVLNGVPSMFLAMIKNPNFPRYDLSSLKSGIIAGSPIYEKDYLEICRNLPHMKLQTSYGLTEASPCVTIADYDDSLEKKAKTSGKIVSNVEVKIIDLDSKKECQVNEVGEIYVKGYNVTKGYLALDPVLCDAVQKDGWLKTGDLAYIDEEGYLTLVGRRKNLIIRGGENISPNEIEECIKEVKNGLEVFIFGMKSEVLQEEIVACLEGKENKELVDKIKAYLKKSLSTYKMPSYFVFVDSFPKNPTGKINEKELKKISLDLLADEVEKRKKERMKSRQ